MKNIKTVPKKLLSVLLSILMVATMIPISGAMSALAAGEGFDCVITVEGKNRSPIEGAAVTLGDSTKQTDATGAVTFAVTEEKTYNVTIEKNGYFTKKIDVELTQQTNTANVALSKKIKVTGKIVGADNDNLKNLNFEVVNQDSNESAEDIQVDETGVFSFVAKEGYVYSYSAGAKYYSKSEGDINIKDTDIDNIEIKLLPLEQTVNVNITGSGQVLVNGSEAVDNRVAVRVKDGTANVNVTSDTANGYHIKSVSGAVEFNNEGKNNAAINGISTYESAFAIEEGTDYTISAVFEINKYDIQVPSYENGTITAPKEVAHGETAEFTIKPKNGYNITRLKANDKDLEYSETANDENEYTATIENVTENISLSAAFSAISGSLEFADTVEIIDFLKKVDNKYIFAKSSKVTIIAKDYAGIKIVTDENKTVGSRINNTLKLKSSVNIKQITVYDKKTHSWENVKLDGEINIVIDKSAPVITVDNKENPWTHTEPDKKTVTVTGKVSDEGDSEIAKVVYSTENNLSAEDIKKVEKFDFNGKTVIENDEVVSDVITLDADGKFSIDFTLPQSRTYYIYALDNSDNVTKFQKVNINIDNAAPTITDVQFDINKSETEFLKFFTFGVVSNTDVKITITANDVDMPKSSEINSIRLFYPDEKGTEIAADSIDTKKVEKTQKTASYVEATYTFAVSADDYPEIGKNLTDLKAIVTDNAGNSSELTELNKDVINKNVQKFSLLISKAKPSIDITPSKANYTEVTEKDNKKTENLWYKDQVDFSIHVKDITNADDVSCGLYSVEAQINGETIELTDSDKSKVIGDNAETPVSEKEYTYSICLDPNSKDFNKEIYDHLKIGQGKNTLTVIAVGNNGETIEVPKYFYVDTTLPNFKEVKVTAKENDTWKDILNLLSFGIFFNDTVQIEVTADDGSTASGVNRIELIKTDKIINEEPQEYEKIPGKASIVEKDGKEIVDNNKWIFELPIPDSEAKSNVLYVGYLYVNVYDNVGNLREEISIADINDENNENDIKSNYIVIEKEAPSVTIALPEKDNKAPNEITGNADQIWYASNKNIDIIFNDENSGLREASAKMKHNNDLRSFEKDDYNTKEQITPSDETKFETDGAGKYVVSASATDNAGNDSGSERTFHVDLYSPTITNFDFGDKEHQDEKGNDFFSKQTYGFYFKKDTKVTITAEDIGFKDEKEPSSGVKSIEYQLKDVNDKIVKEGSEPVNSDNQITITIPKGFKGQISAKATDNVGHTNKFINPSGVIIEEVKGAVAFERTEKSPAQEKTATGQDLYSKSVMVPFVADDTDTALSVSSGIRKVEWKITVPRYLSDYYKENNRNGHIIIDNTGRIEETKLFDSHGEEIKDKEEIDKYISYSYTKDTEDNLVHKLSGKILVNNDSNDITVQVRVTDRSGNCSQWFSDKFSIDKTKPVIAIQYTDEEKANGNYAQYYNKARTATVTVTERNFDAERITAVLNNLDTDYESAPSIDTMYTKNDKGQDYWKDKINKKDPNHSTHVYKIKYNTGDGIYDFMIKELKDLAGNRFDKNKSDYKDRFVMDSTPSKLSVKYSYIENGKELESVPNSYNNQTIRATFTLVEHNADVITGKQTPTNIDHQLTSNMDIKSSSVVSVTSKNKDASVKQFAEQLKWKKVKKDTYQAVFDFTQMAAYEIKVDGQDMAGNKVSGMVNTPKFIIDTNKPELKLDGIKQVQYAAYNADNITPVLSVYDNEGNIDEGSIKVTVKGLSHKEFDLSKFIRKDITNGYKYTLNYFNENKEKLDDIYTMHVEFKDLAGNAYSQNFIISINRWGSNYVYDLANLATEGTYDKDNSVVYLYSALNKVLFTEINCDFLTANKTQVNLIYTNAHQQKQSQKILQKDVDYQISREPNKDKDKYNMKTYQYKLINDELFEQDGEYEVQITTYDNAKNINKNEVANAGTKETILKFVVDKNAPRLNIESAFSEFNYEDESHTAIIDSSLNDSLFSSDGKECRLNLTIDEENLGLNAIDIDTLNIVYNSDEKQIFSNVGQDVKENNGVYNYEFVLKADDKALTRGHDLVITVLDKAKNERKIVVKELLVSNNWLVRLLNNTMAVVLICVAFVLIIAGIVLFVILRKKKQDNEDD